MRMGPLLLISHVDLLELKSRCSGGSLIRFSGFPLFEVQGSGFESKIRASFGIENMRRRWDAEKNPRDYGIAGLKNSTGDLASESLVAWVVS